MKGRVLIVGAGAAGLMAAVGAAEAGAEVLLLEKNEKPGKKIYITGKGRCNLTNDADDDTFFSSVISNPRFLYSAYHAFPNTAVKELLAENGCPVKTERGKRVFPVSDHASDVTKALVRAAEGDGVKIRLNTKVRGVLKEDGTAKGVLLADGGSIPADAVILATGGLSYPSTGSDGDGHRFAKELGHRIVSCIPSLVSFRTEETVFRESAGLTLKNVRLKIVKKGEKKALFKEEGELLFTHTGISGPLVLSASSLLGRRLEKKEVLEASVDLKPAVTAEELDARLVRLIAESPNKSLRTILGAMLPASLIVPFLSYCGQDPALPGNALKKESRQRIIAAFKELKMTVTSAGDFNEAVVTKGGVNVKEIDPGTMESRLIRGLFFAGELIDVDALTGGFNLQIAWSTGYLAGRSAASYVKEKYGI